VAAVWEPLYHATYVLDPYPAVFARQALAYVESSRPFPLVLVAVIEDVDK
jgi:hypothetical protein